MPIQQLIKASFKDKTGKETNVGDIISQEDCWFLKRENRWVLTHKAIQKIAEVAGISKNFEVEESKTNIPSYQNELEHVVRLTIKCNATPSAEDIIRDPDTQHSLNCIHSDERMLTVTGEANRINTPNRGRGYLRKMAEKRAFDIAVLEHLNLYSSVFSEEEAEKFEQKEKEPELQPGTKEFEDVAPIVTKILNAVTRSDLIIISREIKKEKRANKYTELQLNYIRGLYNRELNKKTKSF